MGDVLEFDTARFPLNRVFLRAAGFDDPAQWRCEGQVKTRYWDREVYAAPVLVASHRTSRLRVLHFRRGEKPAQLLPMDRWHALLDAAVVREALERKGRHFAEHSVWVVFDDAKRHEITASVRELKALRERAQLTLRRANRRAMPTADLIHGPPAHPSPAH